MNTEVARALMVETQLQARGIHDTAVLRALRRVPRHHFVSAALQEYAYEDSPLPIAAQQTISQPFMVAIMTQLLELHGHEHVLEIGTGSGYQTAILAECAAAVYSVERVPMLALSARDRLDDLGYGAAVHIRVGDGTMGWPEAAPYDGILLAAAAREVPAPLLQQLACNGVLVLPLGEQSTQRLTRIRRKAHGLEREQFGVCRFVKMIGASGWPE